MDEFEKLSKLEIIKISDIFEARRKAPKEILNTPLIKLNLNVPQKEIYLKLENLQAVGSFKVRGAYNAIVNLDETFFQNGVYTSSAGNFAQGLVWSANHADIRSDIVVPDTAPQVKVDSIKALGGNVIKVPYDEWWGVMTTGEYKNLQGHFIHPSCCYNVMAGNGVIGLEILEQLPDVNSIIVSYGGGGNCVGICSAVKQVNPAVRVYACEVDTASPFEESLKAGHPVAVENFKSSFVDGMNGKCMFPCMWNLASKNLSGSIVTSLQDICDAVNLLMTKNHLVAEGAGAASIAAALKDDNLTGKIVCVVTGGNIDLNTLSAIMKGNIPS